MASKDEQCIRIYFSFRSPYSFLGLHRFRYFLPQIKQDYELIAIAPSKEYTDKPIAAPDKLKYIRNDVMRMAKAYGIDMKLPEPFDVNWLISHAAFIVADRNEKGLEFAYAAYIARFTQGKNLEHEDVIKVIAKEVGLEADELWGECQKRQYQKELLINGKKLAEDGVFGVPSFVYRNEIFWGNDRFDWLLRHLKEESGESCPDLASDPMLRPF